MAERSKKDSHRLVSDGGSQWLLSFARLLEATVVHNDILLVNVRSRRPLEPSKPIDGLNVIAVGPEGMEHIV